MVKKKTMKPLLGEKAGDFAKNIWLAGLGAYGEAYDESGDNKKSSRDLPRLFKELVEKGETIESKQKPKKSKKLKSDSTESLENRLRRVRENLNLGWPYPGTQREESGLEDKIDALTEEVAELRKEIKKMRSETKPPAKKTAATKSRTRKAASSKPSRKKS